MEMCERGRAPATPATSTRAKARPWREGTAHLDTTADIHVVILDKSGGRFSTTPAEGTATWAWV